MSTMQIDVLFSQGVVSLIQYSTLCTVSVCWFFGTQVMQKCPPPSEVSLGQITEPAAVELGSSLTGEDLLAHHFTSI